MYKAFSQYLPHQAAGWAHCKLDHWSSIKKGAGLGFSQLREGEVAGNSGLTAAEQMSPLLHIQEMVSQTLAWDWTSEPGRCGSHPGGAGSLAREGDSQHSDVHRLYAKCYQHRMLLLILPLTGSLSPLPSLPSLPPLPRPQCTCWNGKGRRTTTGVRRPWLGSCPPSAAAASWTTLTEQPRPKCSLQACCLL